MSFPYFYCYEQTSLTNTKPRQKSKLLSKLITFIILKFVWFLDYQSPMNWAAWSGPIKIMSDGELTYPLKPQENMKVPFSAV